MNAISVNKNIKVNQVSSRTHSVRADSNLVGFFIGDVMKICSRCRQKKELTDFYEHKRDGFQYWCKDCHREYNRAYNKTPQRRKSNKKYKAIRRANGKEKAYTMRKDVKSRMADYMKNRRNNPEYRLKCLAREKTRRLINMGKLIRNHFCEDCEDECKTQAHHLDYSNPCKVEWLCRPCHRKLHQKEAKKI